MFFSTQLLSKKGPLATVWLAGHSLDKRLKRAQIYDTSVPGAVDNIMNADAPLALRLSGQLLLGVVRIHFKKVDFLLADCNQAVVKMQQAFKPHDVDLPAGHTTAPAQAITLPPDFNELGPLGSQRFSLEDFDFSAVPATISLGDEAGSSLLLLDDGLNPFRIVEDPLEDEQFDVAAADLARHSLGEIERLRAAPAEAAEPVQGLDLGLGRGSLATDVNATPELAQQMPEAPVSAAQPSPGDAFAGPSPGPSLAPPGSLGLPELDLGPPLASGGSPGGELQLDFEDATAQAHVARHGAGRKRKKLKLDMIKGDDGPLESTTLPNAEIRRLLQDRSELMCQRGPSRRALQEAEELSSGPFSVVSYSRRAADSLLYRPAFSSVLAPALYALYEDAMDAGPGQPAPAEDAGPAADAGLELEAAEPAQQQEAGGKAGGQCDVTQPLTAEGQEGGIALEGATQEPDLGADPEPGGIDVDGDMPGFTPGSGAAAGRTSRATEQLGRQAAGSSGSGRSSQDVLRLQGLSSPPETDADGQDSTATSFTVRTRQVLRFLGGALQLPEADAPQGSHRKRKRASEAAAADGGPRSQIGLDSIVEGRTRRDASAWFFETLVLKTQGYLDVKQADPYGDIMILPCTKLFGPA